MTSPYLAVYFHKTTSGKENLHCFDFFIGEKNRFHDRVGKRVVALKKLPEHFASALANAGKKTLELGYAYYTVRSDQARASALHPEKTCQNTLTHQMIQGRGWKTTPKYCVCAT